MNALNMAHSALTRAKLICTAALALAATAALVPATAQAQHRDHHRYIEHRGFWAGDIHHFHEHDFPLWRGGRWVHDRHDGRWGWWWVVGGVWYFYPTPIYPYPDPYLPPGVVLAPGAGASQYWYYCANPQGYYPYVPQCAVGWQPVPAGEASPAPPQTYNSAPPVPQPPAPMAPPAPAPQQYWFFCDNPRGYYPSVPSCPTPWQRVPANTPPGG